MKKALILNNAYSRLKSSLNQSVRLQKELASLGVQADIRPNDFFCCRISEGGGMENLARDYAFVVYLDKDKYTARMLERCGLRLFNRAAAIEVCDDKMLTSIALSGVVPLPATLPGPLCYSPEEGIKEDMVAKVERSLGYPVIIKESYGSLGSGVFKADDRAQLVAAMQKLKCRPHLFQRFVASASGSDIRVIVVGGRVVAAMRRTSAGDFRSNLELGGSGSPVAVDCRLENICLKCAAALGLDYCGIDVLEGEEGYLVCEVNSNAFFGGIEGVTGINVAAAYAAHMVAQVGI